jgi:hypothetical protein
MKLTLLNREGQDVRTVHYLDTVIHKLVLPRFDKDETGKEALMQLHVRPSRVD